MSSCSERGAPIDNGRRHSGCGRKKIAAERQRDFFTMFGHLTHRFTRKRCYTTNFEGKKTVVPYRIVWEGRSVFPQLVVVYSIPANERAQHMALFDIPIGEKAQHIFFDSEDSYYVQGGKCAEFFRRES